MKNNIVKRSEDLIFGLNNYRDERKDQPEEIRLI